MLIHCGDTHNYLIANPEVLPEAGAGVEPSAVVHCIHPPSYLCQTAAVTVARCRGVRIPVAFYIFFGALGGSGCFPGTLPRGVGEVYGYCIGADVKLENSAA